jgi:hypothetical protein
MTDLSAIDRSRCHLVPRLRTIVAGVVVVLSLTVASGCHQSAGQSWAQNSPVIEPREETVNFALWPEVDDESTRRAN